MRPRPRGWRQFVALALRVTRREHTHTHTYIHIYIYICIYIYMHTYIHTYIYTCSRPRPRGWRQFVALARRVTRRVHTHTHTHIHIYIYIYTYIYIYIPYIHTYIYIYIYICIYTCLRPRPRGWKQFVASARRVMRRAQAPQPWHAGPAGAKDSGQKALRHRYARRMDQPTQRATNYTARSNIEPAQIFLHATGQSAPRSGLTRGKQLVLLGRKSRFRK